MVAKRGAAHVHHVLRVFHNCRLVFEDARASLPIQLVDDVPLIVRNSGCLATLPLAEPGDSFELLGHSQSPVSVATALTLVVQGL